MCDHHSSWNHSPWNHSSLVVSHSPAFQYVEEFAGLHHPDIVLQFPSDRSLLEIGLHSPLKRQSPRQRGAQAGQPASIPRKPSAGHHLVSRLIQHNIMDIPSQCGIAWFRIYKPIVFSFL